MSLAGAVIRVLAQNHHFDVVEVAHPSPREDIAHCDRGFGLVGFMRRVPRRISLWTLLCLSASPTYTAIVRTYIPDIWSCPR